MYSASASYAAAAKGRIYQVSTNGIIYSKLVSKFLTCAEILVCDVIIIEAPPHVHVNVPARIYIFIDLSNFHNLLATDFFWCRGVIS